MIFGNKNKIGENTIMFTVSLLTVFSFVVSVDSVSGLNVALQTGLETLAASGNPIHRVTVAWPNGKTAFLISNHEEGFKVVKFDQNENEIGSGIWEKPKGRE